MSGRSKFRKALKHPIRASIIIWHRIKFSLNYLTVLFAARLGRTPVEIGKGVRFYQKTRITGKGIVVIGKHTTFGIL